LIAVHPLPGPLGAEVTFGYNGEWDDDIRSALREAFRHYHLILLRAPDLLVTKQIELIEALGLEPDCWLDGEKFGYLSNSLKSAPNDGQHSAYLYHSDLMWKPDPISAISLYAIAMPSEPSPTFFASGVGAAAALPDDLRAQWASEQAMFLIDFNGGDTRYSEETASPEAPRATHPILFDDAISQRTSLIIDSLFMVKIIGVESEEGRAFVVAPTSTCTTRGTFTVTTGRSAISLCGTTSRSSMPARSFRARASEPSVVSRARATVASAAGRRITRRRTNRS
jgi:alpha-ketoglutarate-dependent taurine dioxygenase